MLPMIVAWRIARAENLLSDDELRDVCRKQADLIRRRIAQGPTSKDLLDTLALYEAEPSQPAGGQLIRSPAA